MNRKVLTNFRNKLLCSITVIAIVVNICTVGLITNGDYSLFLLGLHLITDAWLISFICANYEILFD